jgi:probable FeS assembly SUF system protein SufT
MSYENVVLARDCEAIQIPHGNVVTIPKDTLAIITQSLGGTYTLQIPSMGGLFRVADRDGDAIGKEKPAEAASTSAVAPAGELAQDAVWNELRNVYDPEIPVNIVDLGLVYDLSIEPLAEGGSNVQVAMTLTAQGCGMGPSIAMDAQRRIESLPGVGEAHVRVVWEPPWNPNMISPEGRAKLGMA